MCIRLIVDEVIDNHNTSDIYEIAANMKINIVKRKNPYRSHYHRTCTGESFVFLKENIEKNEEIKAIARGIGHDVILNGNKSFVFTENHAGTKDMQVQNFAEELTRRGNYFFL